MNEHWASECIGNIDNTFIEEADRFTQARPRHPYFKSVLISFAIVAIGLAIVLTIAFLWPQHEYKLVKENGNYYMYIDDKYVDDRAAITVYPIDHYRIRFDSLDEMLSDLQQGNFTVNEFQKLGRHTDPHGKIELFDISHLYEASFPKDLTDICILFWPGGYSYFVGLDGFHCSVTLDFISEERFRQLLSRKPCFADTVVISAQSTDANAEREAAYFPEHPTQSACYYIITTESTQYYVAEYYNTETSTEIPIAIDIYAKTNDGAYFCVKIHKCTKRPDVAWLASFDVTPYQP